MITREIVICPKCKGLGYLTEEILSDYHKGEYYTKKHDCSFCLNRGRVYQLTDITYEKLPKEDNK